MKQESYVTLYNRAKALQDSEQHQEAISVLRQKLAHSERTLGYDHGTTLRDQEDLSYSLNELGIYEEAAGLDRKTLLARKRLDGEEAADTLWTQHNLARNLSQLGQYDEAIKLNQKTLACWEKTLEAGDDDRLSTQHNLAADLHKLARYKEAVYHNRIILKMREQQLDANSYDLIACRHNLSTNLHALCKLQEAMTLIEQNLSSLTNSRPKGDPQLEEVTNFQKRVYSDIQQAQAKREIAQALETSQRRAESDKRWQLEVIETLKAQEVAKVAEAERLRVLELTEQLVAEAEEGEMALNAAKDKETAVKLLFAREKIAMNCRQFNQTLPTVTIKANTSR